MVELERRAVDAAAESDAAVAKRIADQVASETGELDRDLAYAEYGRRAAERVWKNLSSLSRRDQPNCVGFFNQAAAARRLAERYPGDYRKTQGESHSGAADHQSRRIDRG